MLRHPTAEPLPPKETPKTRYYAISPTRLELIDRTADIPLDEILQRPDLYTPTHLEMIGAVRGMHGHAIGNIATGVVRRLKTECPQSVALAPSQIYDEWKAWSGNMGFMRPRKHSRDGVLREGDVYGGSTVEAAWKSDGTGNFARRVVEAFRFETEAYVANGYRPTSDFDPSDPEHEVAIEQDTRLHVDMGGHGLTVSLRPDYIINGQIVMDDKYGRDFDPTSKMAILQAGMYAMVVDYALRKPYKHKAGAEELRMGNKRFVYRIFRDHLQNPHFEYHEVPLPPTTSYWAMISPYINNWIANYSIYSELQKRREGAFYLPIPASEIKPECVAQARLF